MMWERLLATVVFAIFCATCIESVPFITTCKSDDSKCARESTQVAIPILAAGLPEYNVKPLDPITFQMIDASTSNLKLILTDVTVKGLKNCIAKKVKRDKPKSKLFLKFECSVSLDGQYEMKGHLLILRIEGKGPIHVNLRKAVFAIEGDVEEINDMWNIKDWKHTYELKDKSEVVFENLFNGVEALSKAAQEVIAENGNDIVMEVGPPVIETVVETIVGEINKFFHHVSAKDLSID